MLRSEAEQMVARAMEDTNAQFTDEQKAAIAQVVMKICGRMIEEALSSWRPNVPGSKPSFFTE